MPDLLRFSPGQTVDILLAASREGLLQCENCGAGVIGDALCERCAAETRCDQLRHELTANRDAVINRRIVLAMVAGVVIGFTASLAFLL